MYRVEGEDYYFFVDNQEVHEMYIDFIYSYREEKSYNGYY